MISLIADNAVRIADLCRKQNVRKLEVFGSAATDAFDPDTSDIDMIVDLEPYSDDIADRYLDLAYGLEKILGRSDHQQIDQESVFPIGGRSTA